MALSNDAAERKTYPMGTGVLDYFPDALAEVAKVSFIGNIQHNPGQPLHWAKEKSQDEPDCIIRHYTQRFEKDTDGTYHAAKMCWRALAFLQKLIEANNLEMTYPQYNEYLKKSPPRQIPCGEDVQYYKYVETPEGGITLITVNKEEYLSQPTILAHLGLQQQQAHLPKVAYRQTQNGLPDAKDSTSTAEQAPQTPSEASQLSEKLRKRESR